MALPADDKVNSLGTVRRCETRKEKGKGEFGSVSAMHVVQAMRCVTRSIVTC